MVNILDGNSEHVAHALEKISDSIKSYALNRLNTRDGKENISPRPNNLNKFIASLMKF